MGRFLVYAHLAVLGTVILAGPAFATSYVFTPLATQVERADLIVIGKVIKETPNQYKPSDNCGPNEAVLTVTEVLRGKLESPRAELRPRVTYVQTVRVRHFETLVPEAGNFGSIVMNPVYKDRVDGIWFLQKSSIEGVYCISYPWAERLDQLASVRRCIHVIDSDYGGYKPGFPPDGRTWITTFRGERMYAHTYAAACVTEDGSVFVEGNFWDDLYVAHQRVLSSKNGDGFLARLNPDGTMAWAQGLGSGDRLAIRPRAGIDGSCVLLGEMYAPCSIFGKTMTWSGRDSQLIAGISRDGRMTWAHTLVCGEADPEMPDRLYRKDDVTGIAFVAMKDTYRLLASFTGEVVFDDRHFVSSAGTDWLAATVGKEGQVVEIKQLARGREETITVMAVAHGDRMIVGGWAHIPGRAREAFIAETTSAGGPLWTRTEGGYKDDEVIDLAVMTDGTAVTTMRLSLDASQRAVMSAWSASGKQLWTVPVEATDVEIGADGNIYCFGTDDRKYTNRLSNMPTLPGDTDLVLACYNSRGTRLWERKDGGLGAERAGSMHIVSGNRAVITGQFDGASFLAGRVERSHGRTDYFIMNIPLPSKAR